MSWYRDPAQLDNIIILTSRPRDVTRKLSISSWTNMEQESESPVLYVMVTSGGVSMVRGAEVRLSVHHVDNNGHFQTSARNISLVDDGAAGEC